MVNRESSMSLRQAIHFDDSRRLRRALQDAPRVAWRYHKATRFIDNMLLCIGNRENGCSLGIFWICPKVVFAV